MRIVETSLAGVCIVEPDLVVDERGFFGRIFDQDILAERGMCTSFPQWSVSFNHRQGTLRGLHWQADPYSEVKLVRCTRGAIFDVAVDIRPASVNYARWVGVDLSADNHRTLYIPSGFAHGFQTLADDCEVLYHISEQYDSSLARGVRFDDLQIGVKWPTAPTRIISQRDQDLPWLRDL